MAQRRSRRGRGRARACGVVCGVAGRAQLRVWCGGARAAACVAVAWCRAERGVHRAGGGAVCREGRWLGGQTSGRASAARQWRPGPCVIHFSDCACLAGELLVWGGGGLPAAPAWRARSGARRMCALMAVGHQPAPQGHFGFDGVDACPMMRELVCVLRGSCLRRHCRACVAQHLNCLMDAGQVCYRVVVQLVCCLPHHARNEPYSFVACRLVTCWPPNC